MNSRQSIFINLSFPLRTIIMTSKFLHFSSILVKWAMLWSVACFFFFRYSTNVRMLTHWTKIRTSQYDVSMLHTGTGTVPDCSLMAVSFLHSSFQIKLCWVVREINAFQTEIKELKQKEGPLKLFLSVNRI